MIGDVDKKSSITVPAPPESRRGIVSDGEVEKAWFWRGRAPSRSPLSEQHACDRLDDDWFQQPARPFRCRPRP